LPKPSGVFEADFLKALRAHIGVHHSIYARVPPQGIYFEALVENAFRTVKKPYSVIEGTSRNQPTHDLLVENKRLSLKTERGPVPTPTESRSRSSVLPNGNRGPQRFSCSVYLSTWNGTTSF